MAKYLRLLSLQQVIRSPAYHVRHDQQPRIHFFIQRLTKAQESSYRGTKRTLCPEWTHTTETGGYRTDPFDHDWIGTQAHRLFSQSRSYDSGRRRYATAVGIAFEAKLSGDGTWHGYPIPWEAVPPEIVREWVTEEKVSRRQIKRHWQPDKDDLHWAIKAGES